MPLRALAKERYVMFRRDRNPGLYDEIIAACRNAGFSLNAVHEVDRVYGGLALVAAGIGVALFPTADAASESGDDYDQVTGPREQSKHGALP